MTEPQPVSKQALLDSLPPEWPDDPFPAIQAAVRASGAKVVVLDDDPTGTQTVHGVPVLTEWPVAALRAELENDLPACYLLTNSRSMPLDQARKLNHTIGQSLADAANQAGRPFVVVSRSDSTLRGHFPGEVRALERTLDQHYNAWILAPYFLAGGRYTIGDVHYVAEDEWLVPAGATEFARDAAFGYRASNLRDWVAEKSQATIPAAAVSSISIDDIRRGGPERVAALLLELPGGVCVVNAASDRDLAVFVQGLLAAESHGRRYLYRTAASFVAMRAGIAPRPLLTRPDLRLPNTGGGLIVVGSYVPKSSGQVAALLERPGLATVEIDVVALLDDARRDGEVARAAREAGALLRRDQDAVLYTSRRLIAGDDAASSLAIGRRVSESLVTIVRAIEARPRYLLAKGGITSSDVATQGLEVTRALVLGQILPGVPVWQLGPESRHPGMPYIVFPGNVGGPGALAEIVEMLARRQETGDRRQETGDRSP
jgi:uncharacterized protein YgbK (DUF1537 family)